MVRTENRTVSTLSELGKTYIYCDAVVVPSQSYAQFSGKEVRRVNESLRRIAETGRLVDGEDFFCLSFDLAKTFAKVANCDLLSNHGITLLTRKAVNTLSHYFDDEASIGLSDTVNSIATKVMDQGEARHEMADDALLELMRSQFAMVERGFALARQCKRENDDDTLTATQIAEIDRLIHRKVCEYGSGVVAGFIKRQIKSRFFEITNTRTYKEIARRSYPDAIEMIVNWKPMALEAQRILKPPSLTPRSSSC